MKIWLIQGSLNPNSKTAILVDHFTQKLQTKKIDYTLIDLRDYNLPFVDGRKLEEYEEYPTIKKIADEIQSCTHFVIGQPVYQYSVSGPLKNFLDMMIEFMEYKPFGILLNSGGVRSYMAGTDLINLLFYEGFLVPIAPQVHARAGDFDKESGTLTNDHVLKKMDDLIQRLQSVHVEG